MVWLGVTSGNVCSTSNFANSPYGCSATVFYHSVHFQQVTAALKLASFRSSHSDCWRLVGCRLGAELAKFSLGEAFHCGNLQLRFTRLKHFFMSVRKDKICIHFLFLSLFSFSTDLCIISDILSASCRVTGMENVVCFPPSPFMP